MITQKLQQINGGYMNIKQLLTKLIVVAMLLAPTQAHATGSWFSSPKTTEKFFYIYASLCGIALINLVFLDEIERAKIKFFNQALDAHNLTQLKWLRYGMFEYDQNRLLVNAINLNNLEKTQLLLQCGISPNNRPGERSPLLRAIELGNIEIVKLLLDFGANPNCASYGRRSTALIVAIVQCPILEQEEIIKALLKHGANADITDRDGITALQEAISLERGNIVSLLLDNEPNSTKKQKEHVALFLAIIQKNINIVQLILDRGVDTNCRNSDGQTPLMLAAQYSTLEIVQLLMNTGAKINIKDIFGLKAYDHARHNRDTETREATCAVFENHINKINGARKNHIVRMLGLTGCALDKYMRGDIAEYVFPTVTLDNTQVTIN